MANTITANATVSVALGTGGNLTGSASASQTQSGSFNNGGTPVSIGTSAATISLGGVTVPFFLFIQNTDTTNYVEVDSASGMTNFPQKIPAGKFVLLLPETATIYMKANTAACNCVIVAVDF